MSRLFVSLRFGEAMNEATILKTALEKEGVTAFLSRVPERPATLAMESSLVRN